MSDNSGVRDMWSEDELDRALATLRADERPDERAFSRAKAELLAAARAGEPAEPIKPLAPVAQGRSRRRWGWGATVATVAAVVATVLIVPLVRDNGVSNAAAASRLNAAADNINTVDEPLGPGQYRYVATHAWWMTSMNEYSYLAENLLETWVPADQKQEWLTRRKATGERKWVGGTEAEARADGMPIDEGGSLDGEQRAECGDFNATGEGRKPCSLEGSWQTPNAEFLAALPWDTDQLYDRLLEDVGDRGEAHIVTYVADVLRSGLVPADLRAALYRALGKVPGLQITEETANLDGRKGTAFGISEDGERHDVIIDPATGQFIGERQITEDGWDGVAPGTVIGYTSVTTTVVDGMGVEPTG